MDRAALDLAATARHDAVMLALSDRLRPLGVDRRGACHACGRYAAWFATEAAARRAVALLAGALDGIAVSRCLNSWQVAGSVDLDTISAPASALAAA